MPLIAAATDLQHLTPTGAELILGIICFVFVLALFAKFVVPRVNKILDERRDKIVGEMERAEQARAEADRLLDDYRTQLAGVRDEGNRIIEEARKTADQLRQDLNAKAEQDAQALMLRTQEEIRAERDRVFQELRRQVGQISVELAGRVIGESLDASRHEKLIDDYIDQVASLGNGAGSGGA
jgi:F-type H+-transporting ATPase subunit b